MSSARVRRKLSAATVSPDVAEENAPSNGCYEQSNKATTQQSTGASHVKPCYPEKTINCSDGALYAAVTNVHIYYCWAHSSSVISLIAEEWKARVDLAAIYRICHNLGLNEGINNHLTATIAGMPGHFLVFPFGLLWSEVTASNLLLMDNQACAAAVSY